MCQTKICSKCKQEKLISEFYKCKRNKDGYENKCKECYKNGLTKKEYICENCGKHFMNAEKRRFCCHQCSTEFNDKRVIISCRYCKKQFKQKRIGQIYCCNECKFNDKIDETKIENFICPICNKQFKRLKSQINGKHHIFCSQECKNKGDSIYFSGKNSHAYNHNKSLEERLKERKYIEYYEWRKQVYERDNYTCQCCGDNKGHNLVAHHILNYSEYEELRTDIDNGITLCKKCHKKFHDNYGYKNNNKEQLNEFINNTAIMSEVDTETFGTCND